MMTAGEEAPVSDPLLGRIVGGKFVVDLLLGRGAMGSVYAARHATLGTKVAIKVMHESMTRDATFVERFYREARAASRLDHPNLVRVLDFGRDPDDLLYTVMDFAGGSDLGELMLRDWPLSDTRVAAILGQVLSAIAAAHDVGIVHRDLKPENVIMSERVDDDGRRLEVARVCDFGIAQISEGPYPADAGHGRALTLSGTLLGTPAYMPPEQCRGLPLDARADLYSVGVILYQLLTGRLPFDAENPIDVIVKHIGEEPVAPSQIRPEVSRALEAVCLCALQKQKEHRYPSARAMRAALRDAVPDASVDTPERRGPGSNSLRAASRGRESEEMGSAPPTLISRRELGTGNDSDARGGPDSPGSRRRRRRAPRVVALLGVALVAGALGFFQRNRERTENPSLRLAGRTFPTLAPPAEPTKTPRAASSPVDGASDPNAAALASSTAVMFDTGESGTPADRAERGESLSPRRTKARAAKARSSAASPVNAARAEDPPGEGAQPSTKALSAERTPEPALEATLPAHVEGAASAPRAPTSAPPPVQAVAPADKPRGDPERARVAWRVSAVGGGATAGGVARALVRPAENWTSCYRASMRAHPESVVAKSVSVRLSCDDQGRVLSTSVQGALPQTLAGCIRASALGITIPNADTGEAWANIDLTFQPE